MEKGTTLSMDLPCLAVQLSSGSPTGRGWWPVVTDGAASACPYCGSSSHSIKGWRCTYPVDIPNGSNAIPLVWDKRQFRCVHGRCPRRSFTEQVEQVLAGARVTAWCGAIMAAKVGDDNRSVAEVAAKHHASWPTMHRAVVAYAYKVVTEPEPVVVLGIDETHRGKPRWHRDPDPRRWVRSDRWHSGFVDPSGRQGQLGQTVGWRAADVVAWLNAPSPAYRVAITDVPIDPPRPTPAPCGTRCRTRWSSSTTSTWSSSRTPWSPTSAAASPATPGADQDPRSNPSGPTGGHCSPAGKDSPKTLLPGCGRARGRRPDRGTTQRLHQQRRATPTCSPWPKPAGNAARSGPTYTASTRGGRTAIFDIPEAIRLAHHQALVASERGAPDHWDHQLQNRGHQPVGQGRRLPGLRPRRPPGVARHPPITPRASKCRAIAPPRSKSRHMGYLVTFLR